MDRSKPTARKDRGMTRAKAGTTRGATGRFEAREINGSPQDGFDRGVRGLWGGGSRRGRGAGACAMARRGVAVARDRDATSTADPRAVEGGRKPWPSSRHQPSCNPPAPPPAQAPTEPPGRPRRGAGSKVRGRHMCLSPRAASGRCDGKMRRKEKRKNTRKTRKRSRKQKRFAAFVGLTHCVFCVGNATRPP